MTDAQTPTEAAEAPRETSTGRRLTIFGVYLVLGPPVGGLLLIGAVLLSMSSSLFAGHGESLSGGTPLETVFGVFALTPFVIMFSYLFGGLQAAATGLILAVFSGKEGRFGYGLALLAPVPPGLAALLVMERNDWSGALALGLLGMAASFTLRFLFRKSFGRRAPEL